MGTSAKTVGFMALAVILSMGLAGCDGGSGGGKKATSYDYDKVTIGMTESELVGLLGKPTNSIDKADEAGRTTKMFWMDSSIFVELTNGKVTSKMRTTSQWQE